MEKANFLIDTFAQKLFRKKQ
ncbi:hypothetical protein PBAL39_17869 [Pedobacter sp. BAL39]|nr:hypothetical protein PBAL39_17869 [Pedobacter sp. BAL39]